MLTTNLKALTFIAAVLIVSAISTDSYAQYRVNDPSPAQTAQWRKAGPCRDPWVSGAVYLITGAMRHPAGYGDVGECDPKLYNGGSWNSFEQLVNAMYATQKAMRAQKVKWVAFVNMRNQREVILADIAQQNAVLGGWLVGNDGASIIAATPQQLVAAGGGNMVAAGGGNMVAAGGGNVLPTAGGNIYSLQSGAKRVIRLGNNSAILIR